MLVQFDGYLMSDTSDLTVHVLDDRDIVVVMAGTGFEVTYRKDSKLPMLVATDHLRGRVTSSKAKFLAQAWKAAYQKAKTLGWLNRLRVRRSGDPLTVLRLRTFNHCVVKAVELAAENWRTPRSCLVCGEGSSPAGRSVASFCV